MILTRRAAMRLLAGAPGMALGEKNAAWPIRTSPPYASKFDEMSRLKLDPGNLNTEFFEGRNR
jgi:hypothetical protein